MKQSDIERLRQFFGAYFHQDWMVDDRDADAVVSRFIADHQNKRELASLAVLVDTYALDRNEQDLETSLNKELWCEYSPAAAGMRAGDWLRHVAHRLRAAAAE